MWIALNDGFVSAVEDFDDPDGLVVRARVRSHLETLGSDAEIIEDVDGEADYKFRIFITKAEFAQIISTKIFDIDYFNFKNSVKDTKLHDAYLRIWSVMMELQEDIGWWLSYKDRAKNRARKPYVVLNDDGDIEDN